MRKLIYFPIASLIAVTGKSRPQGETGRLGPASAFHHLAKYLNKSDKKYICIFATLLTFGHPRK